MRWRAVVAGAALVAIWLGGAAGCRAGGNTPVPPLQSVVLRGGAPAAGFPLTVGSFNVHWLADPGGLRATFDALQWVDLWCLQEVRVRGRGAGALSAALERILPPGQWHVVAARVNRLREIGSADWEAQVIASRFPISDPTVWPIDSSGAKRRVALIASVSVGGRPVRVVNADHEPSFFSVWDRNRVQLDRLAARAAQAEGPLVVAGDFNCGGNLWRGYGNAAHVGRADRTLAAAGLRPAGGTAPTFASGPLSLRLDRVYVRGLRVLGHGVESARRGSDHFPVWCTVEMQNAE